MRTCIDCGSLLMGFECSGLVCNGCLDERVKMSSIFAVVSHVLSRELPCENFDCNAHGLVHEGKCIEVKRPLTLHLKASDVGFLYAMGIAIPKNLEEN